ncbi:helix-turn-helix domain-containing protein [Streptomyces sp. NPDC014861]|uniref:helix-turn-helix domain-containing protein n=1 Tax=Streptomyces sp. NPDC014861 TaxID=3364923 RepID=UPI0036F6C574
MASVHPNARPPAHGLVHRNVRLTSRYVVISNDLAQHPDLTVPAIGLAVVIQSLPAGISVGIKALALRTKGLSEMRIAAALRELEAAGFLRRTRERQPDGRFVQYTVSYNRPGADPGAVRETPAPRERRQPPAQEPPAAGDGPPTPAEEPPDPAPKRPSPAPSRPSPVPERPSPAPKRPSPAPDPLPEASRPAAALLAGLRAHEPRLLLSERDVRRLAPGVTAWLERGAHPDAVSRTLRADLPPDLANPYGLLAYRLEVLLPPPLPAPPPVRAVPAPRLVCDGCERPFPASVTTPGRCLDCRAEEAATLALDPHVALDPLVALDPHVA